MEDLIIEIEYKEKDKQEYLNAIRKYLKIKPYKMYLSIIIFIISILFLIFTGMITSEEVYLRYISFVLIFILPVVFYIDTKLLKRRNKKNNEKVKQVKVGKIRYKFTKDSIEYDSFRLHQVYKKEWIKYLFYYDNNLAVLSEDYSAIIIPSITEECRKKIEEMYSSLEKIVIA